MLWALQIKFFGAERSARWILQEPIAFLLDLTCRRGRGGADIENPKMVTRHCDWDQFISLLGQRKWNLSCNILNFMFFSGWILVSNENDLTLRNSGGGKKEGCDSVCDTIKTRFTFNRSGVKTFHNNCTFLFSFLIIPEISFDFLDYSNPPPLHCIPKPFQSVLL